MQFVEELELITNYDKLSFVEFLEFIARLSFLVWPHIQEESLDTKIWRMMKMMFSRINVKVKDAKQFDNIDSESDYEDEMAANLIA